MVTYDNDVCFQVEDQLKEATSHKDYWMGFSDSKARRRAQNRLNQRAFRRRQEPFKWTPLRSRVEDIARKHQVIPSLRIATKQMWQPRSDVEPRPLKTEEPAGTQEIFRLHFPFSTDHLIHLIQFNVFRAVLINMFTIRATHLFSCETNMTDWIRISALPLPSAIPPTLEPTALQRRIPHAPYVDLFPLPGLRDALVLAEGTYDDCELCVDLLGSIADKHVRDRQTIEDVTKEQDDRKGLIVWGEPWRIESWEVEEGFVRKWGWMLKDNCQELLRSTNHWRDIRGEELLKWDDWGIHE